MFWIAIYREPLQGQAAPPYRPLRVHSCPAADSLVDSSFRRNRGEARGYYHPGVDSGYLISGSWSRLMQAGHAVYAALAFPGHGPTASPAALLIMQLRGAGAWSQLQAPDHRVLTVIVDDSLQLSLSEAALGIKKGAPAEPVLPVYVNVSPASFLALARAKNIVVRFPGIEFSLDGVEREDLTAIYRAAVCLDLITSAAP